jgi:7-cyano-7-deazaguanine reductase
LDVNSDDLSGLILGKTLPYAEHYDPSLLQPIPRELARCHLPISDFNGQDIWTAYEVSWLGLGRRPQVAIVEFSFPAHSRCIIESKSFKYYLNSFNQTEFATQASVHEVLQRDLSLAAGAEAAIEFYTLDDFAAKRGAVHSKGVLLDDLPLSVNFDQSPNSQLLELEECSFDGVWCSHLLKSNCPVTAQPDWATVWLGWKGRAIKPESLLRYIISYRRHQDFHENCVERIYCDLQQTLQPDCLWVYARYTRRGGLDINPFRSSVPMSPPPVFGERQ